MCIGCDKSLVADYLTWRERERVMKADGVHGRVWLSTLGCELAAG